MSSRVLATIALVAVFVRTGGLLSGSAREQNALPPDPQFRAGTAVVPIDVRVIDKNGKPVTGLQAADFTVLEDDVRQQVRQFSAMTLTPNPSLAQGALLRTAAATPDMQQQRRVFLIVLGSGRLQYPSKGVDGALRFVREQLMPQDLTAVLAFNRASDFTTNHQESAAILDRFLARHEQIDAQVRQGSAIAAVYGFAHMPPDVQREVDMIFGSAARPAPPASVTDGNRISADARAARDAQMSAQIIADRTASLAGIPGASGGTTSASEGRLLEVGFADFVAGHPQAMQDLANLYKAIEYLRNIDGEKHIIFLTERGLSLPRLEDSTSVASMAADARVVIDTIQTGGLLPKPTFGDNFVISSLRSVSELTGGQASVFDYARKALDRIVAATSSSYLIGYSPTNQNWDGRFRRIVVKVNKPGATVLYRHGYYARNQSTFDRRDATTYTRISTAVGLDGDIQDLGLSFKTTDVRTGGLALEVQVHVDPSKLGWLMIGPDRVSDLDVAIFCQDVDQNQVGEYWQRSGLRLGPETFDRAKVSGLILNANIPVKKLPTFVKVIVYNYGADRIASQLKKIR